MRAVVAAVLVAVTGAAIVMSSPAVSQSTSAAGIRVDTWDAAPDGPLDLSRDWQLNPRAPSKPFRYPPAIIVDGAQRALRLRPTGRPSASGA